MSASGVRREKAALSSGRKPHPATAPAGSNRSSRGGTNWLKPSDTKGRGAKFASFRFPRSRIACCKVRSSSKSSLLLEQLNVTGSGTFHLFHCAPRILAHLPQDVAEYRLRGLLRKATLLASAAFPLPYSRRAGTPACHLVGAGEHCMGHGDAGERVIWPPRSSHPSRRRLLSARVRRARTLADARLHPPGCCQEQARPRFLARAVKAFETYRQSG
jgi:hypothetical protein